MQSNMRWYHVVSYLFGGAALANTLPHLLSGIAGRSFQSPFASPPGVGLSPAPTNVVWGLINLFVAYLLLVQVGDFNLRHWGHFAPFAVGFGVAAFLLARHLAKYYGGA
ncbi:hypothetical protein [Haliangium sp.]|uniref:hypothetical protein n=1 Tax=Haliangium sp. TaxID=2663208 RepID=UPI003D1123A3